MTHHHPTEPAEGPNAAGGHAGSRPNSDTSTVPDPAWIAGLGETGTAGDVPLLIPWLAHPHPRGRAEAVRALRRLGHGRAEHLAPLLGDPSPAVTRQVVAALRPHVDTLDEHHLTALLVGDHPPHVRVAAYRLLHERDTFTRLAVDLHLLGDRLPTLHHLAHADLVNWLAGDAVTAYATPTADQRRRLAGLIDRAEPVLGPDRARALRFHLGISR